MKTGVSISVIAILVILLFLVLAVFSLNKTGMINNEDTGLRDKSLGEDTEADENMGN